jgi:hypothetical protein
MSLAIADDCGYFDFDMFDAPGPRRRTSSKGSWSEFANETAF